MKNPPYTVYVDRRESSIEGLLTVQSHHSQLAGSPSQSQPASQYMPETGFIRLPIRSGQKGFETSSWVRGKSPIPFGRHQLWLKPHQRGVLPGRTGIGEFYPISSAPQNQRLIQHPDKRFSHLQRLDIGLHRENALPGSAGCVVLVCDTPAQNRLVGQLFDFLVKLGQQVPWIPLLVL